MSYCSDQVSIKRGGWVLDGTGSGLSPLSGIIIIGVEPLDSVTTGVVFYYGPAKQ
jgi:hypothetical protein